ncbi:MAG TPA: 5'-nucleotidase C-terminal domain-containing protein, partial [Spirochaetota bacterium]|nr:5'-nucleotidase C-terminal domain-containing protein [Spirochaetota bacterium]
EVVNGIPIFQTMKWGLYVGEIDLTITNKKVKSYKYANHPVNFKVNGTLVGEKISEDEKTLSNIEKAMKNKDRILSKKIATITNGASIDLKTIRTRENEFGNLLCDAILDYTKADVVLQNSGGINYKESIDNSINRTSLDKAMPYDNSVVTVNLTGREIIKILEYSISRKGYGSFLQVGGIKFMYNSSGEVYELYLNKTQLNRDKTYKVAINSWLAIGGDGYELFKEKKGFVDYCALTREVLYDYLAAKKTVKPVIDGRMKFTN